MRHSLIRLIEARGGSNTARDDRPTTRSSFGRTSTPRPNTQVQVHHRLDVHLRFQVSGCTPFVSLCMWDHPARSAGYLAASRSSLRFSGVRPGLILRQHHHHPCRHAMEALSECAPEGRRCMDAPGLRFGGSLWGSEAQARPVPLHKLPLFDPVQPLRSAIPQPKQPHHHHRPRLRPIASLTMFHAILRSDDADS
jgi:hypothetical protein